MKFVFLILLSSDTVGTNIAQYIVSCFFFVLSLTLLYKEMFQCLDSFFFCNSFIVEEKNLHFNFSLIFSIIEGKNFGNFHNHIIMCIFAHMEDIYIEMPFYGISKTAVYQYVHSLLRNVQHVVRKSRYLLLLVYRYVAKAILWLQEKRVYIMYLFTGYDENNPLKTVISRGEADGNKCYPGGQFNKHAKILIISLYFQSGVLPQSYIYGSQDLKLLLLSPSMETYC